MKSIEHVMVSTLQKDDPSCKEFALEFFPSCFHTRLPQRRKLAASSSMRLANRGPEVRSLDM